MNNFHRLHPDIIHTHILSRLDGTTLTALSSVSSQFRHMISNNDELWKNICTSTWPYLQHWNLSHIISAFPCGYRSFFSDAFPSLHCDNNNNNDSKSCQCIDLPPTRDLIYAIDMYFHGEPHPFFTSVQSQLTGNTFHSLNPNSFYTDVDDSFELYMFDIKFHENIDEWEDYFQENVRMNWVLIDPTRKHAGSLCHSSSELVSFKQTLTTTLMEYKTLMPGLHGITTGMVKCFVKVMCYWKRGINALWIVYGMEDMNGELVLKKNANIILLNAIHNGKRKKLNL